MRPQAPTCVPRVVTLPIAADREEDQAITRVATPTMANVMMEVVAAPHTVLAVQTPTTAADTKALRPVRVRIGTSLRERVK